MDNQKRQAMAGLDNYDINGTDTLEQWQAVDNLPSTIYAICKSFVNSTTQHGHTPQHLCVYLLEMCQFLASCWLVNMHFMKTIAENMPREKPPKPEELIERLEEKVPMNLFIILTITITVIVIIIIVNILTLLTLTRWLR